MSHVAVWNGSLYKGGSIYEPRRSVEWLTV